MPCRSPGPHPRGKLRGLAGGGVSRPRGKLRGLAWEGVSRPTPRGVSRPTSRWGVQAHTWGDGWGNPTCTKADPPQQMATAVGGTHPTGMHSC